MPSRGGASKICTTPPSFNLRLFSLYILVCNAPVSVCVWGLHCPHLLFSYRVRCTLIIVFCIESGRGRREVRRGAPATLLICIFNELISIQFNSFIIHLVYGFKHRHRFSNAHCKSPNRLQYLLRTFSELWRFVNVCVCVC